MGALLGVFCLFSKAEAAVQINQVLSGSVTFGGGSTGVGGQASATVAIGGTVNTAHSIILLSASATYNAPGESIFSATFSDSSDIIIQRGNATDQNSSTPTVNWQVIEFGTGVTVTAGSTILGSGVLSKVVILPTSLTSGKALVILGGQDHTGIFANYAYALSNANGRAKAARNDENWTTTANITNYSDSNGLAEITLQRNSNSIDCGTSIAVQVYYQVISFDSAVNVQNGTVSITTAAATATATVTSVNTAQSILFFTSRAPSPVAACSSGLGVESDYSVSGVVTNATTLTFTRATTGSTTGATPLSLDIVWFLVQFTDATSVLSGTLSSTGATVSSSPAWSPVVDTAHDFSLISVSGGSGDTTTGLQDILLRQSISSTAITVTRDGTGTATATIPYFVVEPPLLKVVTPAGGETMKIHNTFAITWTAAASVANVKLEYSPDNGTTWNTIIVSTPSAASTVNSYSWTVGYNSGGTSIFPALEKATQCLVRVTDVANSANTMTSPAFTIKSQLAITAPVGGELWLVSDTTRAITWNNYGNFGSTVKLQNSTNAGSTWTDISGATLLSAGVGTFTWNPIPITATGTSDRIQVISNTNPADVFSASPANFEIRGSITVTAPISTSNWATAYPHSITWTLSSSTTNVDISYSVDNGVTYTSIATNQNAQNIDSTHGSYSWTPPLATSSTLSYIKVVDHSNANVLGTSAKFTITPSITVNSPVGSEVWRVGESHNITWTIGGTGGSITNVIIQYATDFGTTNTWQTVAGGGGNVTASLGSFAWTIPDAISTTVGVKVVNFSDSTIYGTSPAAFSIKGQIVIVHPTGSTDIYTVGSSQVISWTKFGTLGNVDIYYSTNGGVTFPNLIVTGIAASALNYTWNPIPDNISSTAQVKVQLQSDPGGVFGVSAANFSIKGSLTLTAPTGGQTFFVGGANASITWTYTGSIGSVALLYSTDGGSTYPNTIVSGIAANTSPYSWPIPDAIGSSVRVQVALISDTTVNSSSSTNCTIKGTLTLNVPNGGQIWVVGGPNQNITWSKAGTMPSPGTVTLAYSTNGGVDNYPNTITTTPLASALSYSWTIPNAIGTQLRVKITLNSDATVNSASPANFTIVGSFTLSAPNGGETWYVGLAPNISWTTYGTIGQVTLYYSTNGGTTYPNTIATAISNVNGYAWTIPDAIGTSLRAEVVNASDSTVFVKSAGNFTIKGRLIVNSPNGGEVWIVGDTSHNITWTTYGSVGNVDIYYSTDGGVTYPAANKITPTGGIAASLGLYNWPIPDSIGNNLKVEVISLNDSTVLGTSAAVFSIKGSYTLTAPNGGEQWGAGTSKSITWNKTGTLGTGTLQYSTDGGSTYPNTINTSVSSPTNPSSYTWTVPSTGGTTYRVKIFLNSDSTVYSASNTNFTVTGSVTSLVPNGGQSWIVGQNQNITWSAIGITNVKLEYSTDGGTTWPASGLITSSTSAAAASYLWTIPDAIGSNLKVRVSDAGNASVNVVSASAFTIVGSLTLTSPVGGEVWIVGTSYNITWTKTGTIPNVKLDYSTDGGVTYPNAIVASTSGTSPYPWIIPDAISTSVRVRITDLNTVPGAPSASGANFTIKGSLSITAPNGGEVWSINASQAITWTKTGSLTGNVKLEYSTDGGVTYPVGNLISSTATVTGANGVCTPPTGGGCYAWTVSNNPSATCRVRITYLNDTTVSTVSNANFSIIGSVTITAPNGGEVWIVGQSRNITWSIGGAIANVKLDYSTDGGATYPNAIVASTPASNLSYTWVIPDAIGTTLRVRGSDASNSTVYGVSAANFTIKGSLTITSPVGGETWIVANSNNITWTKTGTISNVQLQYSTDGGVTYPNTIVASTPGANLSYAWTVADAIGTNLRVKITNLADTTVNSASPASFTITGSLSITSPVGSEVWIVGDSHNITWTKQGSIANVKLEYSKDGFIDELQTFTIIASTTASTGSYAWTVADAIGTATKVRVSDASNSTVKSVSGANFTIKGKLTITSPVGGEVWTVLSSHNITWTTTGSIVNVSIAYSTDGGSTFPNTITASTGASAGSYAWTIPDAIGATLKVQATNTADSTVFAASPAVFSIIGALSVSAPVGGEQWTVGTAHNITWTKTGSIANVKIDYSIDGGVTYPNSVIASTPATALTYSWTIPNTPSTTSRVRVADASNSTVYGTTAANFDILAGLAMTAPNGGESWTVASAQTITWTTTGTAANVKLDYSTDGGLTYPNSITATTSNTGSYSWTVPDAISTSARVRVTNTVDANSFSASAANFKIHGALTVTAPVGGEQWGAGTSHNVTWTRTGTVVNVKLLYSTDGGTTYPNVIIASTPGSNLTYAWVLPSTASATVRVQAQDASDSTVYASSPANFSITGSFSITSPVGGEVWVVSTTHNITWTMLGGVANAKLEYSTDGGVTYPVGNLIIASTTASTGSYSWTIPDAIGTQLRVRVSDASNSVTNSASPANFTIKGSLSITSPVGGEVWIVGNSNNITWNHAGTFANVSLAYSTDGGVTYPNTITASTPNNGTFAWTVADAIGTTLRVQVSNAADTTVNSVSPANFTIKGSLSMTSPVGGEVWLVGQSRNITWSKTGSIANISIAYSTNGGSTYPNTIIASTAALAGSYAWTVPDAIGTLLRVSVTNTADATVTAASPANFTVKGQISVTAPVGGEVWVVASSHNITWTKQGTFSFVKIDYSTDGGTTYPNAITASVDAVLGTPYAWTVPDAIGSTLRVRVSNTVDTTVLGVSPANFSIVGSFTITAPNGGENWTVATVQNVTWTKVGSIANAKLVYSTDGGTTYPNVIIASTIASTGSYAWTIPDSIGTNRRVQVSDASNSTVFSNSAANFSILGGFTITAPNGGESWTVASSQTITWTTAGTVVNVKLDYSTDGGLTYPNAIVASAANTGAYSWTVPDAITTLARVRVSDVTNANAIKVSAANFKIHGALTVTAPVGGEQWGASTSHNVTWTRVGTVVNVKLLYSTDGGVTYPNVIIASTPGANLTYAWVLPGTASATARVQAQDASDATVYASSPANFAITGSFSITSPVGSEVWIVSTTNNITWTMAGGVANAKLEYSTDGGVTYPVGNLIIASTTASTGSYSWTIPDAIGTTLRVRISDASNAATNSVSPANFTIKGSLTLTSPVGGEVWIVGNSNNITWTHAGTFANVKLEYSTDGGVTYPVGNLITASTPNNNTFAWTVADAIGTTLKVRVSNAADATVNSVSGANFTIKGSLTMTSPVGGEIWLVGQSRNITWSKTGSIANISIAYSTNGGSTYPNTIIASTAASTGSYTWTVADAIGTLLRVSVTNTADATVTAASPANFTIKGQITVTAPVGGEVWVVASSHNITWTKQGTFSFVKLDYSTDGGTTYPNAITASVDAVLGTPYAWTVPDAIGSTLRVRVSNTVDTTVLGVSPANFSIVGSFTITAPNGGENWTVATVQNVTWTKVGSIANAKLVYSTDGGTTYPNVIIASTAAGTGAYAWTIPDSIGTNRRVQVSDASNSTVFSNSAANFSILGGFSVTAPNGGESWTVASGQSITWTTTGTVANVKLDYSTDGGLTYPNPITATAPNTGAYSWTVPDAITTLARVRVSDVNNANAFKVSAANFKIHGALTVTAPVGGEVWGINTTHNITWTRTGTVVNVKLLYSTDGGLTYPNVIIASTPGLNLTYAWVLPNSPSATARVQAQDASDATVYASSPSNFSIAGSFTLTSPVGSEVWIVSTTHNITWTMVGAIANAKLEYSTDGGNTYPVGNLIIGSTTASTLSYSWTIPDAIGTTLRVRISDASNPTVTNNQSPANFTIKGSLSMTSPVGGEVWIVGNSNNITWNHAGTFANVSLAYSTDGGITYPNTITASTPNNGTFAWTVADAIGTTLRVQVSNTADTTVNSVSGANFTIKGSLSMTSPVGGEIWLVGQSRNITWTKTGSIANISIAYSTNGGTTYPNTIIASTAASTGSYTWTVADAIGTTLRVNITNTADATVTSSSPANFTVKGQISVTAPVGGEIWIVASSHNITWTKQGTFSFVKIDYSTDGGTTYPNAITASVDAVLGTPYAWTVPDAIGSTLRVRVSNTVDTTVLGASPANFSITGSFSITAPNGGELWTVATSQNVTWTKVGSIANAKLTYSTDGGTTYPNVIIASTIASTGSYTWTIPDSIGTNRRVQVSDASNSTVFSNSAANFSILGGFSVTAPVGGEVWVVASSHNITWTTAGTVVNVKLDYSTDGGNTYPNAIIASTSNTGAYGWVVPDAITTLARVRVSDVTNANAFKASAANFKITGALTVTAPNGGESWAIATSQNITWTRTGSVVNVQIAYSTDGGTTYPNVIIASTPGSALSYSWAIPNVPTTTARMKISDSSDSTDYAVSASNFSIVGRVTVTAPVGGEVWIVSSNYNITWTLGGSITNVKLQYSTDGGVTWPDPGNVIVASTAASLLSYTWTIPDAISSTVKVRASDASNPSTLGISPANFSIKGSLTMTAPNGSEVWIVGTSQNITWTKTGTISTVKLEYSTDGGVTYPNLITASIPATSTPYAWTIPDAIGSTLRVRVTNTADSAVFGVSAANFSIKGSLAITAPNGSEVWIVGATQSIVWSKTGSIANVQLQYSTDGGVTYPNTIVSLIAASLGSYGWTIPDAITTTAKVKVTNTADTTVFANSAANFKIAGSLTMTAPIGGEHWLITSSQNITWTKTGSIANVKLEYSTDGGVTYPNLIVASVAATATPYAWTVPDNPSTTARVRVTNTADSTVFNVSPVNFNIQGSFALTVPNGGQSWIVGTTQNITWTKVGSIANAQLQYSTDGGVTYPNLIVASTPAANLSYSWVVPDAIGTTVRVNITDVSNAAVTASSASNFSIVGSLSLTAPNGGEVWAVGTTHNITWTKNGTITSVILKYSTDGGTTYPNTIVASTPGANLSYAWNIPDAIGSTLKVSIADVAGISLGAVSAGNFAIVGSLTITVPNGGQVWFVGQTNNITWTKNGSIANVKLEYSTDGFVSSDVIITASTSASSGTYAWVVPDAISNTLKVRVSDASNATVNSISSSNFTIKGILTITAPNGGEKWVVGTTQTIAWNRAGSIANVQLQYTTNGTIYTTITASTPNTGSYSWVIPNTTTTTALVQIINTIDASVNTTSAAYFKIQAGFTMVAPNGGENWLVGSSQNITWTTAGTVSFAKLQYSTDGGVTWPAGNVIVSSTSNTGTYAWTVPNNVSGTVLVQVSDASDPTAFKNSNGNFRIRASFALSAPNGSEQWRVGQTYNIVWVATGTIPATNLQYSRDGFVADIQTINAAAPSTGTYAWTIPDAISNTVKVRVSDPNDPGALVVSAANFRITGNFIVTAPNGGEQWIVANTYNITWTKAGSVTNAKIEYSTDGGSTYSSVVGLTPNNGTYSWVIPNTISAIARVRISDPNDATANGVSAANFKIKANFAFTSPVGGEIWTVGATNNITWTTVGTVPNVQLDYSTDGGTTYPNSITASVANTGTYAWVIPDAISTTVRVRVMSTTDTAAFTTSPANFKIRGSFTLTAPNGGEAWKISQTFNITWTKTGSVANAKLEYSTDGGVTFPNLITASTSAAALSYAWVIPNTPSTTARVRISDVSDSTTLYVSAANFRIQGTFTLTSPVGGEIWTVNDSHNITWSWGGTIPNVNLTYSTDGGVTFPNVIATSAPNGAGASGTFSYAWTIPNSISTTLRVQIQNPSDTTVFSTSPSNFKIQGKLVVTAPVGTERWVTNETHNITWTTTGTIPNVKLEYSTDGGVTYPVGNLITASVVNAGSYAWTIPNNQSTTSRVRVSDTRDSTVLGTSAANFNIDLYNITFDLRDLLSNNEISQLTVSAATTPAAYTWAVSGLASPILQRLAAGSWSATFTNTAYGDLTLPFVADHDQTVQGFMETKVVHVWSPSTTTAYTPSTDTLVLNSILTRDGINVTGAISCLIKVYNGSTLLKTFSTTGPPDVNTGQYSYTWSPSGLTLGNVYTTVTSIGISTGGVFTASQNFTVTAESQLQSVQNQLTATQNTVNSQLNIPISQVQTNLQQLLTGPTATSASVIAQGGISGIVSTQLNAQQAVIQNATNTMVSQFNSALTSFETTSNSAVTALQSGAATAQTAGNLLQTTANKQAWKATVSPNPAITGDTVTLTVSGLTKLTPLLSIYSWDNNIIVNNTPLIESPTPGVYPYTFIADSRFAPSKAYTFTITESTTGAFVTGSGSVESMGLSAIAGLASSAPLAAQAAQSALDGINKVEAVVSSGDNTNIVTSLKSLQTSVDALPTAAVTQSQALPAIQQTVNQISSELKTLGGNQGLDFSGLFEKAMTESQTVQGIRKRTEVVNAAVDLLKSLFESKFGDKPVVSVSIQSGSIIFQVVAANPSKNKIQGTPVKIYLPPEVQPNDIMDNAGLDVLYDPYKLAYYVYKAEIILKPKEMKTFRVEVKDIWMIPKAELDGSKQRVDSILFNLKDTKYYTRAQQMANLIYTLLADIAVSQSDESVSRERHMGIYRENLLNYSQIQKDIAQMEKILVTAGGPEAPEMMANTKIKAEEPSKTMTWIVIFVIILFVGFLAAASFFTWQSQTRLGKEELLSAKQAAFGENEGPNTEEPPKEGPSPENNKDSTPS